MTVTWTKVGNITGPPGMAVAAQRMPSTAMCKAFRPTHGSSWEVETVYDDPIGSSNATVVYIDDENSADFVWNGTNTFITGHWQYNGDHNVGTSGGGTPIHTGKTLTTPFRIKMVKSGASDVALYYGAGTSGAYEGTPFYTHTGVMAGKTTGYIKTLFAVAGSFHVTVRYTQGS